MVNSVCTAEKLEWWPFGWHCLTNHHSMHWLATSGCPIIGSEKFACRPRQVQRLLIKIPIITNWRHWDFIKADQPNNTVILWRGDSTETQNRTTKNESNCWSVWIDTTQPTKKTKNGKVTVDQCHWTSGILNWKKEGSLMVQGSLLRVKCLCVNRCSCASISWETWNGTSGAT